MITDINRYFVGNPNLVGIVTTDDLTAITTTGYFSTQSANIEVINNGAWQWLEDDLALIFYGANLIGFFTYDAITDAFVSLASNGGLSNTLPSGDIFVGNVSNIATGVTMTGNIGINNAGLALIQPGAIVNSQINAAAAIAYYKLAALPSANVLLGNASNVPTATAITGSIAFNNAGVATISPNVVGFSEINQTVEALNIINLTASQIKSLYGTPVVLIPAQGAGTLIVLDEIIWDITYGTTQFTTGGSLAAQYGNTVHGAGPAASSSIANTVLNAVAADTVLNMTVGTINVASSGAVNTGVYLSNGTAAFAAGDSTAKLYIRYHLLTSL